MYLSGGAGQCPNHLGPNHLVVPTGTSCSAMAGEASSPYYSKGEASWLRGSIVAMRKHHSKSTALPASFEVSGAPNI